MEGKLGLSKEDFEKMWTIILGFWAMLRAGVSPLKAFSISYRRLLTNCRGVSAVIGVIILLASLMIGAIVFSQLGYQALSIAQSNNDTAAQNFISSAMSTGWSALNLFIIAAIVMAAGFILALLIAWGRSGAGGGGV